MWNQGRWEEGGGGGNNYQRRWNRYRDNDRNYNSSSSSSSDSCSYYGGGPSRHSNRSDAGGSGNYKKAHHWRRPRNFPYSRPDRRNHERLPMADLLENWEDDEVEKVGKVAIDWSHLPDLAGELVCKYLDPPDLLTMRSVCLTTKRWVESPNNLKKIAVEVMNSKHLQQILTSDVPWNSLSIKCSNLGGQSYLPDLQSRYGAGLRNLKITSIGGDVKKLSLLMASPKLEVLEISDLCLEHVSEEEWKKICRNSENLQEFKVLTIVGYDQKMSITKFLKWLFFMKKLKYLHIPNFSTNAIVEEDEDEDVRKKSRMCLRKQLIQGLSRYLNSRRKADPRGTNLRYMNIESLVESLETLFLELAAACKIHDTQLLQVASYHWRNAGMSDTCDMQFPWSTIKSLCGFDHLLKFEHMRNLTKISLNCFIQFDSRNVRLPDGYQIELPVLQTLAISIYGDYEPYMQSILDVLLHRTERHSVDTLQIHWNDVIEEEFVRARIIAKNFANVKTLELSHYRGTDEDFRLLFSGMSLMENLKLKDCRKLTDNAFVGNVYGTERSPFVLLKGLRQLWIRTFKDGVQDRSFVEGFSRLPLQNFTFTCIGSATISHEGLDSLASLPFKNSIQYLDVAKPVNYPMWKFRKMMDGFPNLKKYK